MAARGDQLDVYKWRLADGGMASQDDISVFVIPLKFAINLPKSDEDDELIVI